MAKEADGVLKLSMWESRLLALFMNGGELFGLQVVDVLEGIYKRRIGFSMVYPNLHKLEAKGFVTSRLDEGYEGSGARRQYYRITEAGELAFKEEQERFDALLRWRGEVVQRVAAAS